MQSPRVPCHPVVSSSAGQIQSAAFVVEPQILTRLQVVMLKSSACVREIFDWLNGTADTQHDEEEVMEEELVKGSHRDCGDSAVCDELRWHYGYSCCLTWKAQLLEVTELEAPSMNGRATASSPDSKLGSRDKDFSLIMSCISNSFLSIHRHVILAATTIAPLPATTLPVQALRIRGASAKMALPACCLPLIGEAPTPIRGKPPQTNRQ